MCLTSVYNFKTDEHQYLTAYLEESRLRTIIALYVTNGFFISFTFLKETL